MCASLLTGAGVRGSVAGFLLWTLTTPLNGIGAGERVFASSRENVQAPPHTRASISGHFVMPRLDPLPPGWRLHAPGRYSWDRAFFYRREFAFSPVRFPLLPDPEVKHRWGIRGGDLEGTGYVQAWSYLLREGKARDDLHLAISARIVRPAAISWNRNEGTSPFSYWGREEDGGYDFAAILRFADPDHYYRVQVSHRWQEVVLWKSTGGVLAVVPARVPAGQTIRLEVDAAGDTLRVMLNGHEAIAYRDSGETIAAGGFGVGVHESEVLFEEIVVGQARVTPAADHREHRPRFREADWHGERWVFDGQQPLFRFDLENMTMAEARLRPDCEVVLWQPMYWSHYLGYRGPAGNQAARHLAGFAVTATGETFGGHWHSFNEQKDIRSEQRLRVTYNPATHLYEYRVETALDVLPGREWDADAGLEYADPIPQDACGSSMPFAGGPPHRYQWILYPAKDGTIMRRAMNHLWAPAAVHRKRDGFVVMTSDREISPVHRLIEAPPGDNVDATTILCAWGYDLHMRLRVNDAPDGKLPGGTRLEVTYLFTGMDRADVDGLLRQSVLETNDVLRADVAYPLFRRGVNTFSPDDLWKTCEPTSAQWWQGGSWDSETGFTDRYSMRLAGGETMSTTLGPSAFSGAISDFPYRFSAVIRTRELGSSSVYFKAVAAGGRTPEDERTEDKHVFELPETGDWQRVECVTDLPSPYLNLVRIEVGVDGEEGTAWIDDVVFEPVATRP